MKVTASIEENSLTPVIYTQLKFNLDILYENRPDYKTIIGSSGKDKRIRKNAFDKLDIFSDTRLNSDDIKIIGIHNNKRVWKYIPIKYIDITHANLRKWKVMIPTANGSGAIGEVLSTPLIGEPLIGEPLIGYTQSFIGIGSFESSQEAQNALKYIKSKFARTMLGILKVTQDNPPEKWKFVPLQDFSDTSDIDWSKSIHEIDLQLYRKYKLDEQEIDFIETHVKEMA